MNSNETPTNPNRMYEITEVNKKSAWYTANTDDEHSIVGVVVQPTECGGFAVRKRSRYAYPSLGFILRPFGGLKLRPLSIKDQRKIENA